MLRVGLTGGIASGKSAVATALAARGAVIIDADVLAREVVEPGTPGLDDVVARFGPEVLDADGRLDRPRLGSLVFADADARRDLERIIHPRVRARAATLEQQADPSAVVVHVIPLLVETGQGEDFDVVVVVDLEPTTQSHRLMARNRLTADEARSRLSAQASREDRLAAADLMLDNTGTPDELADAVATLWVELTKRSAERTPFPEPVVGSPPEPEAT